MHPVRGRVVDERGVGIAGARVFVVPMWHSRGDAHAAVTAADGRFEVRCAGRVALHAVDDVHRSAETRLLDVIVPLDGVTVRMHDGAVCGGVVVDAGGVLVPGATVFVGGHPSELARGGRRARHGGGPSRPSLTWG